MEILELVLCVEEAVKSLDRKSMHPRKKMIRCKATMDLILNKRRCLWIAGYDLLMVAPMDHSALRLSLFLTLS